MKNNVTQGATLTRARLLVGVALCAVALVAFTGCPDSGGDPSGTPDSGGGTPDGGSGTPADPPCHRRLPSREMR